MSILSLIICILLYHTQIEGGYRAKCDSILLSGLRDHLQRYGARKYHL